MKKLFVAVSIVLLLALVVIGEVVIRANHEREWRTQRDIKSAYFRQDCSFYFFHLGDSLDPYLSGPREHNPLPNDEDTDDGTNLRLYFDLSYYRKLTGESLTYDDVREYLSKEYEDDGELRLYTNGRHPQIAKYVEWVFVHISDESDNPNELERYRFRAHDIADDYYCAQGLWVDDEERFPNRAVMDEVIKKEADPGYVMNDEIMLAHLSGTYTDESRAYGRQAYAFYLGKPEGYKPLPDDEDTDDGVNATLYFNLACYRKLTGESLTYDDVKEYLSQEYEDDGEIRIFINGHHQGIAKYIVWFFAEGSQKERNLYRNEMFDLSKNYYEHRVFGSDSDLIYFPNRAVMDEVIKKEADPGYVMNDEIMLAHLGGVKN